MSVIDDKIEKHYKNSIKLKDIYLGNDKLDYKKCKELQKQQDDEWKKMMFLKNLRKEMFRSGKQK